MYFLHTIEEAEESEELLQESEVQSQKESNAPLPLCLGIGTSRHETDSETSKAAMVYSEKEPISYEKRGKRNSGSGLPPVAVQELRRTQDEQSSSTVKTSRRRSSSMRTGATRGSSSAARSSNRRDSSTPLSSRRLTLPAPERSQRRSSSAPPFSSDVHDTLRSSAGRIFGPVVGTRDPQANLTSSKRTGEEAPSTAPRRRRRTSRTCERDDLPAPQWVINLMFDLEDATRHQLTVE